ncbi:hypothetical protein [Rhizobium sp. 768_B6_N1_8]|uniref:hypothetical protein n=1 Tax=unclassified Rhizobium TaxID=2613769 RepID=UPI003F293BD9
MEHSWVVIAWLGPTLEERLLQSDLISVETNPGFLKTMGITSDRSYRPWVIKPKIEVWQEVVRRINKEGLGLAEGRNSQLSLRESSEATPLHYNFTVRHYRPGTLCIEVSLLEALGSSVDDYFRDRNLDGHPLASSVVDWLIGIISCGQLANYPTGNSYSARAAMMLPVDIDEKDFEKWKQQHQHELVGLLINNKHFRNSNNELTEKVMSNNKELDLKYAKSGFSLVSKQGVLTAFPKKSNDLSRDLRRVHRLRFRFLEYALALQKFTEKYQEIRSNNREKAIFLLFLSLPFLSEKANLPQTVTGSKTWRILAEEFSLERTVSVLEDVHVDDIKFREKYYVQLPPSDYESLDYATKVQLATRPQRNWLLKDFGERKLVQFSVGTILTIVALIFTYIKLFH